MVNVMLDIYTKLKSDNKEFIILINNGKFYYVFNDDAYIIYYLFNYKINNNMVKFPDNILNKVIKELKYKDIGYIIYNKDIIKEYGDSIKYNKYYLLGIDKYNKDIIINNCKCLLLKLEYRELKNIYDIIYEYTSNL